MKKTFHIQVSGSVQGVGFRPFVYNLAREMQLTGYVFNSAQGVTIEVEGKTEILEVFLNRLKIEKPVHSFISSLLCTEVKNKGFKDFKILVSEEKGEKSAFVLPDLAICGSCLKELFDPQNRRYLYPFLNCTHCGPRFSIINDLPYDRKNTSMQAFEMCGPCKTEFQDMENRRFHAQPNACPTCGPAMQLWDETGEVLKQGTHAIEKAAKALKNGKILALKGIGGFQLICDARNFEAVKNLRIRKHRPDKPFALLYPSLEKIEKDCHISEEEKTALLSAAAPIVLLQKKNKVDSDLAKNIAPRNPYLGIMLPCSPLHHILIRLVGFPLVATSGNIHNEPICIDEAEALERLNGIADLFLVHNRPIVRPVDDSVVKLTAGKIQVIRSARGYSPQAISGNNINFPLLAVGGHLKNTIAISAGKNIFMSQHLGNLENAESFKAFQNVINDFQELYDTKPQAVVCDLHEGYLSTQFAKSLLIPVIQVQHHQAHIIAAMADNKIDGKVLGVAWDGTGQGTDNTIWGGEFLICKGAKMKRAAYLRNFRLPGGEASIKQPARTAFGLLYELWGNEVIEKTYLPPLQFLSEKEKKMMSVMLEKKLNSPATSSLGRLFDAVASLLNLNQQVSFEGQAAMQLEFLAAENIEESYSFEIINSKPYEINWQPVIEDILIDLQHKISNPVISAKFHNALAELIVEMAKKIGEPKVVLSGGCFQNKYLTEKSLCRLKEEGFEAYFPINIPPNDGGISLGQLIIAQKLLSEKKKVKQRETVLK